jgi:hypothetical protein
MPELLPLPKETPPPGAKPQAASRISPSWRDDAPDNY